MSTHLRVLTALRAPALLLSLAACSTPVDEATPVLVPIVDDVPTAVTVLSAVGGSPLLVPVRLENAHKAAISGTTVDVAVSGGGASATATTISVASTGYGYVEVTAAGGQAFTVSAAASADGAATGSTAISYAINAPYPSFGMGLGSLLVGPAGAASAAAPGTDGVAFVVGREVWWQPAAPGSAAHRVLEMEREVKGLVAEHIDDDGVLDLAVWGGAEAILLRGLREGGYTWAGGWDSIGGDVVGIAVKDLNADRLTDLVVASSGDLQATIELLSGNGNWGFESLTPLEINHEVLSVSASDEDLDGRADVTILDASSGTPRRYTLGTDGWAAGATFELQGIIAEEGWTLLPQADLDGNGSEETIAMGIPLAGAQDLVWWTTDDIPTQFPLQLAPFYVAQADMDLDGAMDLLALEDDLFHVIGWKGDGFTNKTADEFGAMAPIAAGQYSDDEIPDLAKVSDAMLIFPGRYDAESGDWRKEDYGWTNFTVGVTGPILSYDVDGDGLSDIIGHVADGSSTALAVWLVRRNAASGELELEVGGRSSVGAGASVYGLQRCGNEIYSLVGDGDGSTVFRFRMVASGASFTPDQQAYKGVDGTLLACGQIDTGEDGVVVATTTGAWASYAPGMGARSTGTLSGAAYGITLADTDGDGAGEVRACEVEGCSILAADLNEDGVDELVVGGASVALANLDGSTTALGGAGNLSLADTDGDGITDVVALDPATGRVYAYRNLSGTLAPPVVMHTPRSLNHTLWLGDATDDGIPELIARDIDDRVVISSATTATAASSW